MNSNEKIATVMLLLGLLVVAHDMLYSTNSVFLYGYLVIAFLFFSTYALKLFTSAETHYIVSLLRTKRFIPFIEKISRSPAWDTLADVGLVLGFGAIGIDYLFGRNTSPLKRFAIITLTTAVLFMGFLLLFGQFLVPIQGSMASAMLLVFSTGFALGGLMLFALTALVWQALDIIAKLLAGKTPCPGIAPMIPGVQMPNVPPALTPPLYIWLALVIILVLHELSHGALIKRIKAKIKSVGVLLAGLLPIGAFIEPDESEIKQKPDRQQMRAYAIGPAVNIYSIGLFITIGVLFAAIFLPVTTPFIERSEKSFGLESVTISKILDDSELCGEVMESPAKGVLEEGWIIRSFSDIELKSLWDLKQAILKKDANVSLLLETPEGKTLHKTLQRNRFGKLGVVLELKYSAGKEPSNEYLLLITAISIAAIFLGWLLLLSFAVGVVNFLPIEPFDGGKIAKLIFLPYLGFMKKSKQEKERLISKFFITIVVSLLLLNAMPLFL